MSALAPLALTRQHYTRLRHYWHGRSKGAGSRTDLIDLDLASRGLVERSYDDPAVVRFRITNLGEVALAQEHERQQERCRPHHDLAGRLGFFLRANKRITWENIQLLAEADGLRHAMRPDLYSFSLTCNLDRLAPQVHEVKISRSDFWSDVRNPAKRQSYALVAERIYYVVPAGMVTAEEVPPECGLVVEDSPGQFRTIVQPKKQKVTLGGELFMNLMLKNGQFNPL